ncbi:unnamed protein product [Mytilus edulis]|uniref:Death domain-containing protein n=1 Tax=Mytilus edulis TaxID=6550 RepID=A0A8S3PX56_MYTED|nr:unnamed protein product [Mytilus edulis]
MYPCLNKLSSVEGNKILLYIIHRTSSGLIVPDIATGVKECLVITMERISDFYQSTIHTKRSQQSPFHIEYTCSKLKCFINEKETLQTSGWICDKHNQTHKTGHWRVWNQDQTKEQCEEDCQLEGLNDDALNKTPSDIELLRFSNHCESNKMHELVTHLGMVRIWKDIEYNHPKDIQVAKFLLLSSWKEMKTKCNFKTLSEALISMGISTHVLCQVKRVIKAETDIPADYLDCIPTDEILDALAPQIGQVYFQLGAEFGLSISILENIKNKNPRDLAAQNREVLFTWREDRSVKPTIRVLIQALVNIGKGARCLKEVLENVDLSTLKASEDTVHKSEGAIPQLITVKHVAATSTSDKHIPCQRNVTRPSRIPIAVKRGAPTAHRKPCPDPMLKGKKSDKY